MGALCNCGFEDWWVVLCGSEGICLLWQYKEVKWKGILLVGTLV